MRTLTQAEVLLVRGFVRRSRIAFWVTAPLALLTAALAMAIGVSEALDRRWWLAASFLSAGAGIILIMWSQWSSAKRYAEVTSATPVRQISGVLHTKGTRAPTLHIGAWHVQFAHASVRRALSLDEPCVADVIWDAPLLVVAARPAKR